MIPRLKIPLWLQRRPVVEAIGYQLRGSGDWFPVAELEAHVASGEGPDWEGRTIYAGRVTERFTYPRSVKRVKFEDIGCSSE